MTQTTSYPSFGLQRRHLLGAGLAMGMAQLAPWSWAAQPAAKTNSFLDFSRYLTERDDLSAKLGARMLAALQSLDGKFSERLDAMWNWVQGEKVPLAQLNERLKAAKPEWADVPGQVMQAWYLGIVGGGTQAKVVTYEFALNAQTVSDKLRPPSYSYGVYGSWTSNPTTFNLQRIALPA